MFDKIVNYASNYTSCCNLIRIEINKLWKTFAAISNVCIVFGLLDRLDCLLFILCFINTSGCHFLKLFAARQLAATLQTHSSAPAVKRLTTLKMPTTHFSETLRANTSYLWRRRLNSPRTIQTLLDINIHNLPKRW